MRMPLLGSAFLVFLVVVGIQFASAQRINHFTLPPWTHVTEVPWHQSTYRFPEFRKGKITYSRGFELHEEFLNYNIYYERMFFISEGDTLVITNSNELKSVQIGNKTFFHDYNSGFYEVILPMPVSLAFRNQFFLEGIENKSGVTDVAIHPEVRGEPTIYTRIYKKQFDYFFIDQNNELNRASKSSILKLFPNHQGDIQGYLLLHQVDFESREDLIALTIYCNQFIIPAEKSNKPTELITAKLYAGETFPSGKRADSLRYFPEFKEAKILWSDKSSSYHPEKMNYNLFTGKMDVINEKGDTTNFMKWQQAKILNLDGDVFYHDFANGYLQILIQGKLALAVKNAFAPVTDKQMLTDSGLMEQAAASAQANSVTVTSYDRLYELEQNYFFIYNNQVHDVKKLSILRLLSRHKEKIIAFMDENNTSLEDRQDLMDLTTFCNQLLVKD